MSAPRLPFFVLLLWFFSLLGWWMFAFYPAPSDPPAWLAAARTACFGAMPNGLPDLAGWLMLAAAPLSFLVGIFVLWGEQVEMSLKSVFATSWGKLVFLSVLTATGVEANWILTKVITARQINNVQFDVANQETLDENYPVGTELAPDFKLVNQENKIVSLEQFKGKPVLITFAFAHCQSMCPMVIEKSKQALKDFPKLPFLIVTLDPWRDTPSSLPTLKTNWKLDDHAHVLSAHKVETVINTVKAFKVPFERNTKSGEVTHPGLIFLIDSDGRIAYTFNNPPANWIQEGIRRLLGSNRTNDESVQKVVKSL
ncbi:MAG: SCO family protein [Parachlamydiales bacterium]